MESSSPRIPMSMGECRRTRRGVMYCRLPIGTRFCPTDTKTASECERRIRVTGDKRRGRWRRERVGSEIL